jgi:DNA-binding IclR family transcriptional regulator
MVSFAGRHNRVKVLSFCRLNGHWLTSSQLVLLVDSSPACLRTLLSRWTRWGLVTEHLDGEGTRSYTLSPKGYSWLSKHWQEFPLSRWVSELPEDRRSFFLFLFKSPEF